MPAGSIRWADAGERRGVHRRGGIAAVRVGGDLWEPGEPLVGVLPDDAGGVEVGHGRVPLAQGLGEQSVHRERVTPSGRVGQLLLLQRGLRRDMDQMDVGHAEPPLFEGSARLGGAGRLEVVANDEFSLQDCADLRRDRRSSARSTSSRGCADSRTVDRHKARCQAGPIAIRAR